MNDNKGNDSSRADIASPRKTKELMNEHGFTLKKSLGQNFLTDRNILDKIVSAAELDDSKGVLEIGPGVGALTEQLAKTARRVVAVEIDKRLMPVLASSLRSYSNVQVIHADILEIDLQQLFAEQFTGTAGISVVANLPYYITTPIIMRLLEERLPIEHIVVMVQKEVAERMTARPGTKDYGSLSIAVQYYCETQIVTKVPRTVFIPPPNVESAVIKLSLRRNPPIAIKDESFFFQVVQACFAQRRKTIYNNLLARYFAKDQKEELLHILQKSGIDPSRRGETLAIEEYAVLVDQLYERMK